MFNIYYIVLKCNFYKANIFFNKYLFYDDYNIIGYHVIIYILNTVLSYTIYYKVL